MDATRGFVLAVAATVVAVPVVMGPFGPVDVPQQRFVGGPPGEGSATVTLVSPPGQPTIAPGRQGGETYYLRIPDVAVRATDVQGNPILSYSLDIEALGYSRSSVHFLGSSGDGDRTISMARDTLPADRIDRDSYRGRFELVFRANGTERVIYAGNTTVEVRE